MNVILSASKAVSDRSIHVISEYDVEQLKRNILFQYPERKLHDYWLTLKIEDTIKDKLKEQAGWTNLIIFRSVHVRLYPKAIAVCVYDIMKDVL